MFADDCLVYRIIDSVDDIGKLQDDLNTLMSWASTWQMSFNVTKCVDTHITNATKHVIYGDYDMGGERLEWTDAAPYLGVTLTKNLSWSPHIAHTAGKARRNLGFVRRNLYQCPQSIRERAYKTLVRPLCEYACCVWDPYRGDDIRVLEQVQRSAARFVLNKPHKKNASTHESVSDMISQLGWPSLQKRREDATLIMLYKMRNNMVEIPTTYHPVGAPPRSRRGNSLNLVIPIGKVDSYKYSFIPRAARLWNNLPEATVQAESLEVFKASLKATA